MTDDTPKREEAEVLRKLIHQIRFHVSPTGACGLSQSELLPLCDAVENRRYADRLAGVRAGVAAVAKYVRRPPRRDDEADCEVYDSIAGVCCETIAQWMEEP